MKLIPKLLAAALVTITLTIAIVSFTGCALVSPTPNDGTQPNALIKIAAKDGTWLYLKKHPEQRPAFLLAAAELAKIEQADVINFGTVLAIVNQLPVKELKTDVSYLIFSDVTILLENLNGLQLDLSKTAQLRSAIIGLRQGLELGAGKLIESPLPTTAARTFSDVPPACRSP